MTIQTQDNRPSRERFTRTIEKICIRLDARNECEYDFKIPATSTFRYVTSGRVRAKLVELQAFGSWARGASHCADLDLFARIERRWLGPLTLTDEQSGQVIQREEEHIPPFTKSCNALIGRWPEVNVLDLAAALSQSVDDLQIDMSSTVPIWAPGSDWRAAIASIKIDANAGRKPRPTDALHLRLEQLGIGLLAAERLLEANDAGLMSWEYRDHQAKLSTSTQEALNSEERLLAIDLPHGTEAKRAAVHRALVCTRDIRKRFGSKISYRFVESGLAPDMFDRDCSVVIFTPKWTRVGPNGSLVVKRGPNYTEARARKFVSDRLKIATKADDEIR